MMDIISIISGPFFGAVGAVGTGIAIYEHYNKKQLEERLDKELRKNEKNDKLSEDLHKLRKGINHLCDPLIHPTTHEDLDLSLRDLGRDVLAYHHTTGKPATVCLHEITTGIGNEKSKTFINEPEQALSAYKNQQFISASHRISDSKVLDSPHIYDIHHPFPTTVGLLYEHTKEIKNTYTDFSEQFEFINKLTELLDELVIAIYKQMFQVQDGVSFDPSEYDSTSDLNKDIYDTIILSETARLTISELERINDEIYDMQKQLISN